ncbi:MAG TPA: MBL fold metallo-hydrolase [Candidatus Kapabacteria bacterium]|nr:MBL fold metallo-hydrolase [Candidatus Kapabacteria bacterium]
MQITFCGASRGVTGSCFLLETKEKRVLIDCGMFQGSDFNEGKNSEPFPFDPKSIDAVFVTHPHLDHVGRIPKLVKEGFTGYVYMTAGAKELARLIWNDAYHIMLYNHRKFQQPLLFDDVDIANADAVCRGVNYEEALTVGDISVTWHDAGHIFGSAFLEICAEGKRVVCSGDLGNTDAPIIKDTRPLPDNVDLLLIESTYGDRLHESKEERDSLLLELIKEGVERGGTIMMPAFSLERTQEILYRLHEMSEHDRSLPRIPIFLDSPLAIDATEVYKKYPTYYDKEAFAAHTIGDDFLNFPELRIAYTKEESKAINGVPSPKMIIAGSGMMNGGRILHHAFRYLPDPASSLIIVGYQAEGTLGRRLYEGASQVTIFGERVDVRCKIKAIGALSAHADQKKLLSWVGSAKTVPNRVYCIHGEPHAATELAHRIRDQYSVQTFVPDMEEQIDV